MTQAGRLAVGRGLNLLCVRCRCLLVQGQPSHRAPLRLSRGASNAASRTKTAASQRTLVQLSELPRTKLDAEGKPAKPLGAYSDGSTARKRRPRAKSQSPAGDSAAVCVGASTLRLEEGTSSAILSPRSEEEEYRLAVQAGDIPDSPLAKQVFLNWKRFPDCIVLTRVGKFYESYFAPAITLSSLLSLKLAYKRYANGIFPFSGFPVHQLEKYLKLLVQDLGHTVVLVEEYDEHGQKEVLDPVRKRVAGTGAELKDRRVGRVVTPGTLVEAGWLTGDESRYLLAIAASEDERGGWNDSDTTNRCDGSCADRQGLRLSLAYTDASTGEFFAKDTTMEYIEDELARISPREVVLDATLKNAWQTSTKSSTSVAAPIDSLLALLRVLGVHVSFADPGISASSEIASAGVRRPIVRTPNNWSLESLAISLLRHHLEYALRDEMPDLTSPTRMSPSSTMQIDAATLHALEIRHALRPGGFAPLAESYGRGTSPLSARGTLLSVISRTVTPSGHRLLVRTLTAPSTDVAFINSRLALVQSFIGREPLRLELRDLIRGIGDVMRIVQRFKGRRGDGRDAWEVARWIRSAERVLEIVKREVEFEERSDPAPNPTSGTSEEGGARLVQLVAAFKPLAELASKIEESLDEAAILRGTAGGEENQGLEEGGDAMVAAAELTEEEEGKIKSAVKSRRNEESKREEREREREEKDNEMWWMKPSFSRELQALHDRLGELKRQRVVMQADLRKKLDVTSLVLVRARNTYLMVLDKKAEFSKIDKLRRFVSITEGKSLKSYAYNPWSALGARTDSLIEELLWAQRRAFDELRQIIVEYADGIQANAELVDELDLTMGFAQVAVENGYSRPILNGSTDMIIVNGRHPTVESSLLASSRFFTPNSTHLDPKAHLHIITGPNQGGKSTLLRQTAIIAILAQAGCFVPAERVEMGVVDRVFSRVGARDDLYRDRSTFMLEMVETAAILRHATPRSLIIMDEIGRGTTLSSGLSIAFATLSHILDTSKCRTLFATHYHELAEMLRVNDQPREGVAFWCTDVDEVDDAFSYSYKLQPGINHQSHAVKAARIAGMPESFIEVAEFTLAGLDAKQLKPGERGID